MTERVLDLSPTKLVAALAGTFLVLSAATWLLLIAPKQTTEQHLQSKIKTAQTALNKLTQHEPVAHKQAVSESLLVGRALPSLVAMPQLVLQLNRIATEEHLVLTSITPSTAVPYSGYQAIPMSLTLTGDSLNVVRFLQQLRDQVQVTTGRVKATGRLYDVLGVTLQAATAPAVTATLQIQAFYFTGTPLPTPGAPATTPTS